VIFVGRDLPVGDTTNDFVRRNVTGHTITQKQGTHCIGIGGMYMRSDKQPGVIVRSRETSDGHRRLPTNLWKTEHRFLPSLGKFGFRSDEAVAYNYHAAYYLGGKLNRITEWQHDLDENYLEHWRQPKLRRRM
jgi:hypothetical protein